MISSGAFSVSNMARFVAIIALLLAVPSVALAQERFTYARVVGILFGLVNIGIAIGITLTTIVIIWNGIKIMTGRSIVTPEQGESYSQAKKNIWYALIGFVVIIGVWVILATIQRIVTTGTL